MQFPLDRHYEILINILDGICKEAPIHDTHYHPKIRNDETIRQARSRAILHLYLKTHHQLLNFSEREKYITDHEHDGGIDAYYIDNKKNTMYFVQSKLGATAKNFKNDTISADNLKSFDLNRTIKNGETKALDGQQYCQSILKMQKAVKKATKNKMLAVNVVLIGNVEIRRKSLIKTIVGYDFTAFNYDRVINELVFPILDTNYYSEPNLTIEIKAGRTNNYLEYMAQAEATKPVVKILFVPTREIGRIMNDYKNSILRYNPRNYLELSKNPVNSAILNSIQSTDDNEFALLNNGITILSTRADVDPHTANKKFDRLILTEPQIVNGGQTAFTLARIYKDCIEKDDFKIFKDKEVMLRVITFQKSKKYSDQLITKISEASNAQTKIEESDRRSNDPVQRKIQKELFNRHCLLYECKRGEFADSINEGYFKKGEVLNRNTFLKISLAMDFRVSDARSHIKKYNKQGALETLLGDLYPNQKTANGWINLSSPLDLTDQALGYKYLKAIEKKRKSERTSKKDPYNTKKYGCGLKYGQYALLAVCIKYGMRPQQTDDEIDKKITFFLNQWKKFEQWSTRLPNNSAYKSQEVFDFDNYYKGSTIRDDLKKFEFKIK